MTTDQTIEVFRCTLEGVAQMAIDEVLTPLGIPADIHNRTSHALPAPASMAGGYFIAVPHPRAAEAIAALREALSGGVLPEDGEVEPLQGG
jgi:hypothetical protein